MFAHYHLVRYIFLFVRSSKLPGTWKLNDGVSRASLQVYLQHSVLLTFVRSNCKWYRRFSSPTLDACIYPVSIKDLTDVQQIVFVILVNILMYIMMAIVFFLLARCIPCPTWLASGVSVQRPKANVFVDVETAVAVLFCGPAKGELFAPCAP